MIDVLLSLNDWARPFIGVHGHGARDKVWRSGGRDEFLSARRAAHIKLLKHEQAFREWASEMTLLSATLPAFGPERDAFGDLADIDISDSDIPFEVVLAGLILPGAFTARKTRFAGDIWADNSVFREFDLSEAKIVGELNIDGSTFEDRLSLSGVEILWTLNGRNIRVARTTDLSDARFEREVWFRGAEFQGALLCRNTEFCRDASFGESRFLGQASFQSTRFQGTTSFDEAVFTQLTDFRSAQFAGKLWFTNVRFEADAAFGLARFAGDVDTTGVVAPSLGNAGDIGDAILSRSARK